MLDQWHNSSAAGPAVWFAVLAVHHRPPGYGRHAQESTLAFIVVQKASSKLKMDVDEFFTEYGEANRYQIREVIGKGSYGVVCSGELVHLQPNCTQHASYVTRIVPKAGGPSCMGCDPTAG
jgi:hypothetical protein